MWFAGINWFSKKTTQPHTNLALWPSWINSTFMVKNYMKNQCIPFILQFPSVPNKYLKHELSISAISSPKSQASINCYALCCSISLTNCYAARFVWEMISRWYWLQLDLSIQGLRTLYWGFAVIQGKFPDVV